MKQILFQLLFQCLALAAFAQLDTTKTVVLFDLKKEIAPEATRITQKAINEAERIQADLILVHMNTYGGYVVDADSIRTALLNTKIPTYVFIDNNAASAGALISLACDKIYMRKGSSIGATTVVNEDGAKAPDKYQSYMRKQMRSTAESHGRDTIVTNGDTTYVYFRNPDIAEGMVDERVIVKGLVDSTKVITLTTEEAITWGYCEGTVENIDEILALHDLADAEIIRVTPSAVDKLVAFFANPALRSILLLAMIGGIYFELQSPGIGFALAVSILAAVGYFAPLYIDGLAENWEILLFIVGIILLGVEIFVIPGFGIAGVSGVLLIFGGLILAMVRNVNFDFSLTPAADWDNALASLLFALLGLGGLLYFFGARFIHSRFFQRVVQKGTISARVAIQQEQTVLADILGQEGKTSTALRPMGRIELNGLSFECKTYGQFVNQGAAVKVIGIENHYLIVSPV